MPKKTVPKRKTYNRKQRLHDAKTNWVKPATTSNLVKSYSKWYGVNRNCAIRELQLLGYELSDRDKRISSKQSKIEDYDSDETFAFIADYTEGGAPFGITHEEWEEMEWFDQNFKTISLTLSNETYAHLQRFAKGKEINKAIERSIVISLYISQTITLSEAATIANLPFTTFIAYLTSQNIPWHTDQEDGYYEYQKSIESLLLEEKKFNYIESEEEG
ncbi:MAG: UPF0175 family protein [Bacillaceae bacterium]|nr:UPF0175 family protein [Bacillaceae bacterium]